LSLAQAPTPTYRETDGKTRPHDDGQQTPIIRNRNGGTMNVAIVYDSSTGTTKAAAEQMAETVRAAGHACTVEPIERADPAEVTAADAICVGSWTKGLYVILQGPTPATLDFIERLGPLEGRPAAVFATYAIAIGKTLQKMSAALTAQGATVNGRFKSKGPTADEEFDTWVHGLDGDEAVGA
jgi:flavodoxin